jgi:hypothetical protein
MSYGVAANTRIAGATDGTFLDDLTTGMSFPTSYLVLLLYHLHLYISRTMAQNG